MAFKHRYEDGWYKNAAGLYVQMEPIDASLVAAASTNAIPRVKSDDTIEFATLTAGSNVTITHGAGAITIAASGGGGGGGGGLASPDDPPASPNTEDDEFDSSTLNAKWTPTLSGSPSVDIDTTWASRYMADFTGSQSVILRQSYAPAGDFSLTAKVHGALSASGQLIDLFVGNTGETDGMFTQWAAAAGGVLLLSEDSSSFTQRGSTASVTSKLTSTLYLHLQRVGSTWSGWLSQDGWSFCRIATHSKSFTVGVCWLRLINAASPPCRMGIDWVRRDWVTL